MPGSAVFSHLNLQILNCLRLSISAGRQARARMVGRAGGEVVVGWDEGESCVAGITAAALPLRGWRAHG